MFNNLFILFSAGSGSSLVILGEIVGFAKVSIVILNICSLGRKLTTSYHILAVKSTHNIGSEFRIRR